MITHPYPSDFLESCLVHHKSIIWNFRWQYKTCFSLHAQIQILRTGQIKKLAIEHSNNLAFKMLLLLWASNCFWTIIYYPFTWFFEVNIPLTNVLNKFSCTYICRISHLQTIKSVTWFFVRMWQTNCIHQLLFFFSRGTSYEDFILVLSLGLKKKTLMTFSVLNQRLEG